MINEIVGMILMLLGSMFLFLGALGLLRMPDIYNRLQAGTKATTLGIIFTVMGAGVYYPPVLVKSILIVFFVLMTNPVSSSTLARSAYKNEVEQYEKTADDTEGL